MKNPMLLAGLVAAGLLVISSKPKTSAATSFLKAGTQPAAGGTGLGGLWTSLTSLVSGLGGSAPTPQLLVPSYNLPFIGTAPASVTYDQADTAVAQQAGLGAYQSSQDQLLAAMAQDGAQSTM